MHSYDTYGPFEIPRTRTRGRLLPDFNARTLRGFWTEVSNEKLGLSNARGCYVFAISAGGGIRPWYVGQSKTGFRQECFQPTKKVIYTEVCAAIERGKPVLILVARLTSTGNFMRGRLRDDEASFVERMLMLQALSSNPDLKNVAGLAHAKQLRIPGLLNSPKGTQGPGARLLRRTLA